MKPTIIKTESENSGKIKPTVIQYAEKSQKEEDKNVVFKSSVIKIATESSYIGNKPSIISKSEHEEAQTTPIEKIEEFKPSIMSGYRRLRISVSIEKLHENNPGVQSSIIEKALQYVLETNLDLVNATSAVLWGSHLQKQYGDHVMLLLNSSQQECLSKSNILVSRVIEILESIDLRGVSEYKEDGIISKLFKSSNKEFDTPEELLFAEKELKHLISLLSQQLKSLLELQATLQKLNHEIELIESEIKSASIAATFISNYLLSQSPSMEKYSNQYLDRSMSLTQTYTQILENNVAREMQIQHPLNLINIVQNTVLVMIPDWLGSITSIRAMLESNKRISVTEINELNDWRKKILNKLKA